MPMMSWFVWFGEICLGEIKNDSGNMNDYRFAPSPLLAPGADNIVRNRYADVREVWDAATKLLPPETRGHCFLLKYENGKLKEKEFWVACFR